MKNKNISKLIAKHLNFNQVKKLKFLGSEAQKLGFYAYLVGGVVRDVLMDKDSLDLDIVIEGDGIEFAKKIAEKWEGKVVSHQKFHTAILIHPDKTKIDIATARTESYPKPGILPIVKKATIKDDLYRRDFTINAMAMDITPKNWGDLIDFFQGQDDLKKGKIRVLHELSFRDDPTRIFRAVRFEQRFGFDIDKKTKDLICDAVNKKNFKNISCDRIKNEIVIILQEKNPYFAIKRMAYFDEWKSIGCSLKVDNELKKVFENISNEYTCFIHAFPKEAVKLWEIYLLALLNQLRPKTIIKVSKILSFNKMFTKALVSSNNISRTVLKRWKRHIKQSQVYVTFGSLPMEAVLYFVSLSSKTNLYKPLKEYLNISRFMKTQLSGKDLISLGVKKGPQVSKLLKSLYMDKLDGFIKSKKDEVKFIKESI